MERLLRGTLAALLLVGFAAVGVEATSDGEQRRVLDERLVAHLRDLAPEERTLAKIHAASASDAAAAARGAGMTVTARFDKVGVAFAVGDAAAIAEVAQASGVTKVEGDDELQFHTKTSHDATRGDLASQGFSYSYDEPQPPAPGETKQVCTGRGRKRRCRTEQGPPRPQPPIRRTANSPGVTGSGVSVAVIDSGVDGTHPMFNVGGSKVLRNLRLTCPFTQVAESRCYGTPGEAIDSYFTDWPTNDTDTLTAGGHGTHVASTAVGVRDPANGTADIHGAATGAKLVALSIGDTPLTLSAAEAALNWVLEHHDAPCGAGVAASECPPIKVINNSYGPVGTNLTYDENSTLAKIQRALVAEGVVVVWSAGNGDLTNVGGDGSDARTTTYGHDTTPGIISVANYDDQGAGSRQGTLSSSSSRGKKGAFHTYPDISAPGTDITAACRPQLPICRGVDAGDPDYGTISGTSMAAPHVTGIVAQLFEANPSLTPADVENILEDTAHPFSFGAPYEIDPMNTDHRTSFDKGHGLVDAANAVTLARKLPGWPDEREQCSTRDEPISSDAAGDGTGTLFVDAENEPQYDILDTRLTFDGSALTITSRFADIEDMDPQGSVGRFAIYTFGRGASSLVVRAIKSDTTGEPAEEFALRTPDDGANAAVLTGDWDPASNTVSFTVTNEQLVGAEQAPLVHGELLTLSELLVYRDTGPSLPADTAGPWCAYRLGAGSELEAPPGVTTGPDAPPAPAPPTGPAEASIGVGETYAWNAGPFTALDLEGCEGARVGDGCDRRFIEVRVPEGGATLTVTVTPDLPAWDFDLYVFGPDGASVGSDGDPANVVDGNRELVVATVRTAGLYRIEVNPFGVVDGSYAGEAKLAR